MRGKSFKTVNSANFIHYRKNGHHDEFLDFLHLGMDQIEGTFVQIVGFCAKQFSLK